jgi:hydroxymethylglutaryl-CoA lyase
LHILQISVGATEIAIFAAASEGFSKFVLFLIFNKLVYSRKNINCSVDESITRFTSVCKKAKDANVKIRGYVSCVIACPYDGPTKHSIVDKVVLLF